MPTENNIKPSIALKSADAICHQRLQLVQDTSFQTLWSVAYKSPNAILTKQDSFSNRPGLNRFLNGPEIAKMDFSIPILDSCSKLSPGRIETYAGKAGGVVSLDILIALVLLMRADPQIAASVIQRISIDMVDLNPSCVSGKSKR